MTADGNHPADVRYVLYWRKRRPAALVAEAIGWTELRAWQVLAERGLTGRPARSRRWWTREELAVLATEYPTMGQAWCARRLRRTASAVQDKARRLGLRLARETISRVRKQEKLREVRLRGRYQVSFGTEQETP